MKKHKGFKYRIYPNKEQEELIFNNIHSARFIYNKMLSDKIDFYNECGEMLRNTPAQYKDEFEFLKRADAFALCNVQLNLDKAFKSFFRKQNDFPKYKSRKKVRWSYTTSRVNNNIEVKDGKIKLPKIGWVKIKLHRPFTGEIKSVTVSVSRAGRFYASVLCEYDFEKPNVSLDKNKAVGFDYSSKLLYVDNKGESPLGYEKQFEKSMDKLASELRKLSKMKLDSNNFKKQKQRVAKVYEHISNQRLDFLHKESTRIANLYDYIFVEDIDMKEISKENKEEHIKLGRQTHDNAFGMFRTFLEYKMEDRGKVFHKINRWFASSQICSNCGSKRAIDLNERIYVCYNCGFVIDRDKNAAINILNQGFKEILEI